MLKNFWKLMLTDTSHTKCYTHLLLAVVALGLALFGFYYGLGSYHLLNNNEGLYASIAKSMLLNKAFLIPHLNCMPYLEKPPLLYWLLASSFAIFGPTAFAARLVTTTCGFLVCLTIFFFCRKYVNRTAALIALLIFATSPAVIIIARMVYFDMLLTLLFSGSLMLLYAWNQSCSKLFLRTFYGVLALSVLTKGLVAVILAGGTFLAYILLTKQIHTIKKLFDLPGIIIFLGVALPWHVLASLHHDGFAWNYLINEQLLRFLHQRVPHDYYDGPFYYYLPRIVIYLTPWSLFLPTFLVDRDKNLNQPLKKFLWCWVLIPLLFFSLSSAKANYYMIVSMPALAMLLGIKITELLEANKRGLITGITIAIFFVILIIQSWVSSHFQQLFALDYAFIFKLLIVFLYTSFALLAAYIFFRRPLVALFLLGGLVLPITLVAIQEAQKFDNQISAADAGIYVAQLQPAQNYYLYQEFEKISAIAFYADHCFKIIDNRSNDLYYAAHLPQYADRFLTVQQFLQSKHQHDVLVIEKKKLAELFPNPKNNPFKHQREFFNLVVLN
jgi:4-amino-4-deoxy-L-arabinose transferase-like glycosyltransferase